MSRFVIIFLTTFLPIFSAYAQECHTIMSCYASAKQSVTSAVAIEYEPFFTEWDPIVLSKPVQCTSRYENCFYINQSFLVGNVRGGRWSINSSGVNDAGQGLMIHNPEGMNIEKEGYSALSRSPRLNIGQLNPNNGFTILATIDIYWRSPDNSKDLVFFTIYGDDFAPIWQFRSIDNSLSLVRMGLSQAGLLPNMIDTPWDFDRDTLNYGVSGFRNSSGDPLFGIIDVFITFRPDGKVNVAAFPYRSQGREQLITHIQDPGYPVKSYPSQPYMGVSLPADYYKGMFVTVGSDESGGNFARVPQLVIFGRMLSDNEQIGYHARGRFIGGVNREPARQLSVDMVACNSGEWMNKDTDTQFMTVCGPSSGVRKPN